MKALIYSLMPPVAMGILLILGALPENNRWLSPLAMAALGEVVAFFLPLLVFWLLGRKGPCPMNLRLGRSRLRFAPFVFFSSLAVSLLSFFLNYLVALFTGGTLLEDTAYSAWSQYGGTPTWILVLVIAFLPALAEELFFRGGLLSGLEGWGQTSAILISALCFAMIHGTTANFLGPLTGGLLFGYMTVITGSVWPAVFGHCFNNVFYLVVSYLFKRYAAFGIWPYFVMLAAAVLFLSIYGAASCLENLIEKGRVPRLRGSGGAKAVVRSVLCPGVLAVAVLFVLKALLT